MSYFIIHLW